MYRHIYYLVLLLFLGSCLPEGSYYMYNVGLYKNTPVWQLAKAVKEEDIDAIKRICKEDTSLLNFREPKFEATLLYWAVYNEKDLSAKVLLELGADPNAQTFDGETPMMRAAARETSEMLQLMLAHGGWANDTRPNCNGRYDTPLKAAAQHSLENTKILVEAGADVNYTKKGFVTPVGDAANLDKIEIVDYLLQHGATFIDPIWESPETKMYLWKSVEFMEFEKGTPQYALREKILEYLDERVPDSLWVRKK